MKQGEIHVLHVVPTWEAGGMELALARVARAHQGRGVRHTIVAIKDAPSGAAAPHCGVEVHCIHAADGDPFLPWRLRLLLRRFRPDVIHAHNWGAWPDVAAARLLTLRPAPLVFSFHGLPDAGPMPWRRRAAYRLLAPMAARIFTVSEGSRRMLADHVHLPARRIEVIPNGVDTELFSPAAARRCSASRPLVVGSVGSLTSVKNHSALIKACGSLARAGVDLELRIAGAGPLAGELLGLGSRVGLDGRLVLAGHLQDVPGFLRGLDVFALPSRTEGHPNALLEAMACGLACAGSNVHGIPEVLQHGRLGLLVDPDDEASLAGAIARLAADPRRRGRLGRAARRHVCLHYSMERMAAEYLRLYESVAATGRKGGTNGV